MSTNDRALLASLIRRQIEGLNQLLADAHKAGLSASINDRKPHQVLVQAYAQAPDNWIIPGHTFYVHAITHTTHEEL
jgi:hypothetical protein